MHTAFATVETTLAKAMAHAPAGWRPPVVVAASKTQPEPFLREAIALGISHFGENRVQEMVEKWPPLLEEFPQLRLHLIGPLQTNKVREAVRYCQTIETIDRPKLADAVASEAAKQGKTPSCLIQVNTGEEPQKAGITPRELEPLLRHAREISGLNITGLMCIPPVGMHPAPHFALLKKLADRYGLPTLSMGMSSDYVEAARMGATHIRLGTALFGERA